jgi:thymidylate kinase
VRAGYLELMRAEPERWVRLEAALEVEALQAEVWTVVSQRLGRQRMAARNG